MEKKSLKTKMAKSSTSKSVRIDRECQKVVSSLLSKANNKKAGRKVKFDQLLQLALELVTDDHIKRLQDQTLKHEDRQELLRQNYVEVNGPISKDEFIGFMMTPAYFEFLKAQKLNSNFETAV